MPNCLTCNEPLINDPHHTQWHRCLRCDPEFAAWYEGLLRWQGFTEASSAAARLDKVGRPTRYGQLN